MTNEAAERLADYLTGPARAELREALATERRNERARIREAHGGKHCDCPFFDAILADAEGEQP